MAMATHTAQIAAVHIAPRTRAWATDLRVAGGLLLLAGATILMGIITAEALYPGSFSTGANEMALIGVLVLAGSSFVHRAFGRRSVAIPIATLGIGALGVGPFPGIPGTPHAIFAMVTARPVLVSRCPDHANTGGGRHLQGAAIGDPPCGETPLTGEARYTGPALDE